MLEGCSAKLTFNATDNINDAEKMILEFNLAKNALAELKRFAVTFKGSHEAVFEYLMKLENLNHE
jgi:ABC-type nitrate/sulfonate/bicarbonate transport system substrate-binding protein